MPKEVIHLTFDAQAKRGQDQEDNKVERTSELILDPNVDFQEGIGKLRGEQTFFPRQVIFDFKGSLGSRWDAYDVVFEDQEDGEEPEENDDAYGILRPSRAANEGLHAWGRPAEVLKTYSAAEGLQSTRVGPLEQEDGEESDYETDREEDVSREGHAAVTQTGSLRSVSYSKPSAYAHNPLHPRSLRPVPSLFGGGVLSPMDSYDSTEGRTSFSSFEMGIGLAKQMDRDESLLDENLRWFAEDSDQLQSFNLSASTFDGFSGMAHEVAQVLADDFSKIPVVAWGLDCCPKWQKDLRSSSEEIERLARLRTTNNVLALWSFSSTSMYVPMASPFKLDHISSKVDWSDMYQLGGLYAAHIDTATMSTRLHDERQRQSVSSIVQGLNWRRNTPIAQLGGCLPTPLLAPVQDAEKSLDPIEALLAARGYDPRKQARHQSQQQTSEERAKTAAKEIAKKFRYLTPSRLGHDANSQRCRSELPFAQVITARDGDPLSVQPTSDAVEAWSKLEEPVGRSTFVPLAFNVRTATFPAIFSRLTNHGRPRPRTKDDASRQRRTRVESLPMLTSLVTTPATSYLLSDARKWIDEVMVKGHAPLASFGIGGARGRSSAGQAASEETEGFIGGREGLIEIREHLEELLGAYEEGLGRPISHSEEDQIGTDEEFAHESDDSDWDIS